LQFFQSKKSAWKEALRSLWRKMLCAVSSCEANSAPQLVVLQLPEAPPTNVGIAHQLWILDDDQGRAKPLGCNDESYPRPVQPGDLMYFPQLISGAGEFEGVRYVGERLVEREENGLPLLFTSVESPIFPGMFAQQPPQNLRQKYEPIFHRILQSQGGLSLEDLFGGVTVVEEFWANPDVERRRLTEIKETWVIPLKECTCVDLSRRSSSDTSK
jgi:hypothetical protein